MTRDPTRPRSDAGGAPHPGAPGYADRREAMVETLADAVDAHVDLDVLLAGTRVALPRVGVEAAS